MANRKSPATRATEIGMACTEGAELRSIIDSLRVILKVRFPYCKDEPLPVEEKKSGDLVFVETVNEGN